jgi:hypothetical protein
MASHMQQTPIPMASSLEMQHMHISHQQPGDVEYMHAQENGMYYPQNYMMYEHDQMGWYGGHGEHEVVPGADPTGGDLGVDAGSGSHDGAWAHDANMEQHLMTQSLNAQALAYDPSLSSSLNKNAEVFTPGKG